GRVGSPSWRRNYIPDEGGQPFLRSSRLNAYIVGMKKTRALLPLGEFEMLVLLASLQAGDGAYGSAILEQVHQRGGRSVARGARDAAIGDLNEEFAAVVRDAGSAPARRWYWIQTFSLIRAFAAEGRPRPAALGEISVRPGGDTMTQDLRYALRALRRSPAFT